MRKVDYSVHGETLASSLPLEELPASQTTGFDWEFDIASRCGGIDLDVAWFDSSSGNEAAPYSFGLCRDGYLLRFFEMADFVVTADGRQIRCYAESSADDDLIRHLLLNQVVPALLSRRGRLVIHASACLVDKAAIAFMGVSGAGKSTLAASLGQLGYPTLTDDCLLFEEARRGHAVIPGSGGLRLWPDSLHSLLADPALQSRSTRHTTKQRVHTGSVQCQRATDCVELRAIYALAGPDVSKSARAFENEPLSQRDAFVEMVRHLYQFDPSDRATLQSQFEKLDTLVRNVPVVKLSFPHDYGILPEVCQRIVDMTLAVV